MEWPSPSSDASRNLRCHREIVLVSFVFQCQKQERLQRRSSHREVPTHLIRWVFSCRIYRALPACFLFTCGISSQPGYVSYQEIWVAFYFCISEYCSHNLEILPQEMFPLSNNWCGNSAKAFRLGYWYPGGITSFNFKSFSFKNKPAIYPRLTNIKSIVFIFHANMGGKQCYRQRATRNKLKSFDVWNSAVSPTHRGTGRVELLA